MLMIVTQILKWHLGKSTNNEQKIQCRMRKPWSKIVPQSWVLIPGNKGTSPFQTPTSPLSIQIYHKPSVSFKARPASVLGFRFPPWIVPIHGTVKGSLWILSCTDVSQFCGEEPTSSLAERWIAVLVLVRFLGYLPHDVGRFVID